jgi:hypothetical protein
VQFIKWFVDGTDFAAISEVWVVVRPVGPQVQRTDEGLSLDNGMLAGPRAIVELASMFGSASCCARAVDFEGRTDV